MAHEGGVQVLEDRFLEWRSYVRRRQAIDAPDVDELAEAVAGLAWFGMRGIEPSNR